MKKKIEKKDCGNCGWWKTGEHYCGLPLERSKFNCWKPIKKVKPSPKPESKPTIVYFCPNRECYFDFKCEATCGMSKRKDCNKEFILIEKRG